MKAMPLIEYLSDPCPEPSLDSSTAWKLITKSPLHAWHAHPRLNTARTLDDCSSDMDIGSACHAMLLEQDQSRFVIVEADDWRTKDARAAREQAHADGLIPLLARQHQTVCVIVAQSLLAIARCEELVRCAPSPNHPICEHVCLWQEGETWCRARPDLVSTDHRIVLNYKTTKASADPDSFGAGLLVRGGYHIQAYHHGRGVAAVTGEPMPKLVWLIQETEPPYAASILGASPSLLALAESQWRTALDRWRACMASGEWPAYPRRVCWIEAKPWDLERWMVRPDVSQQPSAGVPREELAEFNSLVAETMHEPT